MHWLLVRIRTAAIVAVVLVVLVVVVTIIVARSILNASPVHAGSVADLSVGVPVVWEARFWLVRDGFGDVHAFPTEYDSPFRHQSPVVWLPAGDSFVDSYLQRDACAHIAGHGIFNVQTPANSRYDATGRRLFGIDRPRLDSYQVRVSAHGDITVDTGTLNRTGRPTDADTDGLATPTPARPPFGTATAPPSPPLTAADCAR